MIDNNAYVVNEYVRKRDRDPVSLLSRFFCCCRWFTRDLCSLSHLSF